MKVAIEATGNCVPVVEGLSETPEFVVASIESLGETPDGHRAPVDVDEERSVLRRYAGLGVAVGVTTRNRVVVPGLTGGVEEIR